MPHRTRPRHQAAHPLHVTLRAVAGLPTLRGPRVFAALSAAFARATSAPTTLRGRGVRVVQFSAQADHLHLLVEATNREALSRGMQGLASRLARAVNHALGRTGRVWGDRYHARTLTTPREVRNALVYVIFNWKKHRRRMVPLPERPHAWCTAPSRP